jgi:SAM-dependent methyltransferase
MIAVPDRIASERAFHDRQAAERRASFRAGRADLRFDLDQYLDHETWIRPAFEQLGPVRGKRNLDLGCGHGMMAVVLARRGAIVTALDLSPGYANETRERAAANRVPIEVQVGDAESLPFADQSFDAIWGNAILHHLHLPTVAKELHRVLKPGGVAVFCEPWGGNPLLRLARRWLPYPGKRRTPDERPLLPGDLHQLHAIFPRMRARGFQLLGMLRRVHPGFRFLDRLDHRLFRVAPFLEKYGRYMVLTLPKD